LVLAAAGDDEGGERADQRRQRSGDARDRGDVHASWLRTLISAWRVRWTGHLSAISRRRARCSSSSAPSTRMTRRISSILPALVSQSSQSVAWIFWWVSSTETPSRGHLLRSAYMRRVIDVQ